MRWPWVKRSTLERDREELGMLVEQAEALARAWKAQAAMARQSHKNALRQVEGLQQQLDAGASLYKEITSWQADADRTVGDTIDIKVVISREPWERIEEPTRAALIEFVAREIAVKVTKDKLLSAARIGNFGTREEVRR